MTVEGVDYAWDRPSVAGLVSAGKRFVVRYGGPGSDGKQIQEAEARALIAAGLSIVANAEGAADGLLGGRAAGIDWARQADQHFWALGMPADRPIYLSVDFDAGSAHWPRIDAALRGAAEVLGGDRVGVYGGYDTIAHCASAGTARWLWQTYAWSEGRWHPRAHLQQYRNGVSLVGGTVDLNRAMVADYGQWGQGDDDDMVTDDDVRRIAAAVANQWLGSSGPTLGTAVQGTYGLLQKVAERVDVDPAELAAITEASRAGVVTALADTAVLTALAAALAPLLQPGVTVEQLRAVLAGVRLSPQS